MSSRLRDLPRRVTWNQIRLLFGGLSLAAAIFLVVYYAISVPVERAFGERYVNSEIPLIFPFYVISSFKPITLISYLVFLGVVLTLEANKHRLRHVNVRGARILLLFLAFVSGYEVLWNFYAWFATWQRTGGILDLIANTHHEYTILPVNFNFATKIVFLVFALTLYGLFFLQSLERNGRSAKTN